MEILTRKKNFHKEPGTFRGTLRGTTTMVRELWAISIWTAAGHTALFLISIRDQLLIKRVKKDVDPTRRCWPP